MSHAVAATSQALLLLYAVTVIGCTNQPSSIPVPLGGWGGGSVVGAGSGSEPVRLSVGANESKLFGSCFIATMPGPLVADRFGRFDMDGTWAASGLLGLFERPVHFSGRVEGTTMTLTATMSNSSSTFVVRHGAPANGLFQVC